VSPSAPVEIPLKVHQIISDFSDIMPVELLDELPLLRDIEHAIDFVPWSNLLNLSHYRMNPTEHAALRRHVDELLRKSFIIELESMCLTRTTQT